MKDITKPYDDNGFGDGFITTENFLGLIYDLTKKKYGTLKGKKK